MILFPAIDIKDGQCVRLYQGDYDQLTVFNTDPVAVAQRWQQAGATWLHVVDLDGAKAGQPVNSEIIGRICQETTLRVEVGGGMRSLESIASMLAIGVERVILGTAVLTNPALLGQALERWGERIAVGLDARDGRVAVKGWQEISGVQATFLANKLSAQGVKRFIYTDIATDGAMGGPNLAALRTMRDTLAANDSTLIASGGVSSLADLRALAKLGVEGAIIGKALYVNAIDLAIAVREIEQGNQVHQVNQALSGGI